MPHPRPEDSYLKTCSRCGETKPAAQYHSAPTSRDGLQSRCKACQNDLTTARYHADPKAANERFRAYAKANRPKMNALAKKWRTENPERSRDHLIKANYGLPLGTFDKMMAAQEGRCAICGTDKPNGRGRLHIDHDHDSGAIRGLLCHSCNLAIGHFHHDPKVLSAAIAYLSKYSPSGEGS